MICQILMGLGCVVSKVLSSEFFWSAVIASIAWLLGKGWELSDKRRVRYAEITSKLHSLGAGGAKEEREKLISELSRLWIEAPKDVVKQSSKLLDLIDEGKIDEAEDALVKLVQLMRKDTGFLRLRINLDKLDKNEIKLRKAN